MHWFHTHGEEGGHGGGGGLSLPMPKEGSSELRLLDPAKLAFRREGPRLQLRLEGEEEWREVNTVRLFPLTEPERWVSIIDKEGKEVGVLVELKGLTSEALRLVREELRRRYLVPQISRILACRERFDLVEWTVQTDRGKRTFLTRNLREQVKEPMASRLMFTDVEGNRYDIPDVAALDPDSRRWIEARV
jgi:hypothetical protein